MINLKKRLSNAFAEAEKSVQKYIDDNPQWEKYPSPSALNGSGFTTMIEAAYLSGFVKGLKQKP